MWSGEGECGVEEVSVRVCGVEEVSVKECGVEEVSVRVCGVEEVSMRVCGMEGYRYRVEMWRGLGRRSRWGHQGSPRMVLKYLLPNCLQPVIAFQKTIISRIWA